MLRTIVYELYDGHRLHTRTNTRWKFMSRGDSAVFPNKDLSTDRKCVIYKTQHGTTSNPYIRTYTGVDTITVLKTKPQVHTLTF